MKKKLGKGLLAHYFELQKTYDRYQKELGTAQRKLVYSQTLEEAEKYENIIRGTEACLKLLRDKLQVVVISVENVTMQEFPDVISEYK